MIKYVIATLCFLAAAEAGAISPARVSLRSNPFGIVEGIVPCGSHGQILQVRVTDCTRVPCQLVTGRTYSLEIDFRPSVSHPGLDLKVVLFNNGDPFIIVDGEVPGSAVEAGGSYTLTYPITVEGFILGPSDLRVEVSGRVNTIVELCGIAGIYVVNP